MSRAKEENETYSTKKNVKEGFLKKRHLSPKISRKLVLAIFTNQIETKEIESNKSAIYVEIRR